MFTRHLVIAVHQHHEVTTAFESPLEPLDHATALAGIRLVGNDLYPPIGSSEIGGAGDGGIFAGVIHHDDGVDEGRHLREGRLDQPLFVVGRNDDRYGKVTVHAGGRLQSLASAQPLREEVLSQGWPIAGAV